MTESRGELTSQQTVKEKDAREPNRDLRYPLDGLWKVDDLVSYAD